MNPNSSKLRDNDTIRNVLEKYVYIWLTSAEGIIEVRRVKVRYLVRAVDDARGTGPVPRRSRKRSGG